MHLIPLEHGKSKTPQCLLRYLNTSSKFKHKIYLKFHCYHSLTIVDDLIFVHKKQYFNININYDILSSKNWKHFNFF